MHHFFPSMAKWNWTYSRPNIRAFCNLFCDIHKAVQHLDGVIIKMQLILYFTYFHSVSVTEIKNKQTNLNHFKKCTLKAEVNLSCISLTEEIKAMQLNYYQTSVSRNGVSPFCLTWLKPQVSVLDNKAKVLSSEFQSHCSYLWLLHNINPLFSAELVLSRAVFLISCCSVKRWCTCLSSPLWFQKKG